ncbi:terminase small subunit, partial [Vibrio phage 1.233.B._10N.261.51.E6]
MSGLTAKQRRFVEEYCSNGFNATQAALTAGYKPDNARKTASENLSKPDIQDAIEEFMGKATKKALITTEGLVERLLSEAEYFGEGASHSARIAALKTLTDFTGGFDANKKQVEHSGSVPLTIILDEDED